MSALCVAGAVTGCGGGSQTTNGLAAKSPGAIVSAAARAMDSLRSVHVSGYQVQDGGTMYIATVGRPYMLELSNPHTGLGHVMFDRFNAPVSLTPPANAIDAAQQLEALGLIDSFDAIHGSSAGFINASYTAAGQARPRAPLYVAAARHGLVDPTAR